MTDNLFDKIKDEMDPFKKILSIIPGFKGYMERQARRDSDKLLRETIADRFEQQWERISAIQRDFIASGDIQYLDDLEGAAVKLRTFADRVRRATRGYSGLFDAVKINEEELQQLYLYDSQMLELAEEVGRAAVDLHAAADLVDQRQLLALELRHEPDLFPLHRDFVLEHLALALGRGIAG